MGTKGTGKKETTKKLPAALVKNAAALVERKQHELARAATDDVALIKLKQADIVSAFYDIGEALTRLSRPGVAEAAGHAGFAALVEAELGMSLSAASQLIDIVKLVRRQDALRWGQKKSLAMAQLAKATPALDGADGMAKHGRIKLRSGRVLDPEVANANELLAAAKEERAAARGAAKPVRGVTTSREERAFAKKLEEALRAAGIEGARVVAVARPGASADLRIERVPIGSAEALHRVLGKVRWDHGRV
jgi:hypothetical protein